MTTDDGIYNRGLWVVLPLTILLFLAGIVVLPSYADQAEAQNEPGGAPAPAVNHNTWTSGAAMPTAAWFPVGTGVIKGRIYVVGGYTATAVVADNQIYNLATNTWSSGAAVPTPMAQGAGAVVKNVLYVFGGSSDGGSSVSNAVWAYNPKTNSWSSKAAMPTARASTAATVEKNIIYVIGGYSPSGGRLNNIESYNPATDTWTEEAALLVGKSEPTVGLIGTTIVTADGYNGSSDNGDNEGYNASTNSWTSLQLDPTGRNASCGGSIGPQLYVAGGYSTTLGLTALTDSFKFSKNTWKTLASMPLATLASGSAVSKGLLYCMGGADSGSLFHNTVYNNVQIYQP